MNAINMVMLLMEELYITENNRILTLHEEQSWAGETGQKSLDRFTYIQSCVEHRRRQPRHKVDLSLPNVRLGRSDHS